MTIDQIVAIARSSERIFIIGVAALLLYYGYRLFSLNLDKDLRADTEVKYKNLLVRLQGIAPGIFFAALGTGVLLFAIRNQAYIPPKGDGPVVYAGNQVDIEDMCKNRGSGDLPIEKEPRKFLSAVHATQEIAASLASNSQLSTYVARLQRTIDILQPNIEALIDQRFGPGTFIEYQRWRTECSNPKSGAACIEQLHKKGKLKWYEEVEDYVLGDDKI